MAKIDGAIREYGGRKVAEEYYWKGCMAWVCGAGRGYLLQCRICWSYVLELRKNRAAHKQSSFRPPPRSHRVENGPSFVSLFCYSPM